MNLAASSNSLDRQVGLLNGWVGCVDAHCKRQEAMTKNQAEKLANPNKPWIMGGVIHFFVVESVMSLFLGRQNDDITLSWS